MSDVGLDASQMYYVVSYSTTAFGTLDVPLCMRAQGAAPGAQFEHAHRFLLVSYAKVVSIVGELPSCSDADCSLESMSDPEEEEDMPDDKDPSRSEGR